MNAMSALYHIAQNDSPTLGMLQSQKSDVVTSPQMTWSENFKHFISICLKKQPHLRQSANELLNHPFITELSDRNVLVDLIRKTKEIVRDLDNLQYRKMKKIIMVDGSSSSSGGINGNTSENSTLNINNTSRDFVGSESGCSSLINLKNDDSESSHGFDTVSQFDYNENNDGSENENENEASSLFLNEHFASNRAKQTNSEHEDPSLPGIKSLVSQAKKANLNDYNVATNKSGRSDFVPDNQTSTSFQNTESDNNRKTSISSIKSYASLTQKLASSLTSNTSILSDNLSPMFKASFKKTKQALNLDKELIVSNELANNERAHGEFSSKANASVGFATIKTTQTIVCEEQSQREHQEIVEFQNLKKQHAKILKSVEMKCKLELDELKSKLEKEYNQEVQQFAKELDAITVKHVKELDELVNKYIYCSIQMQ